MRNRLALGALLASSAMLFASCSSATTSSTSAGNDSASVSTSAEVSASEYARVGVQQIHLPASDDPGQWASNPLGKAGTWRSNGRQWKTECDTSSTGKNACRSYIMSTYVKETRTPTGVTYSLVNGWVVNNIVKFKTS